MWEALGHENYWQGELWNRRKDGEVYPVRMTISAVQASDRRVTHYVASFADITHHKEAEAQLHRLAFYDPLTELPNRRLLLERLRQAFAASARNGQHGAILFIDLDHFKTLNDTKGHDVGDQLLTQVAIRLRACVRDDDSVARLGGDEFVVMLEDLSKQQETAATAGGGGCREDPHGHRSALCHRRSRVPQHRQHRRQPVLRSYGDVPTRC